MGLLKQMTSQAPVRPVTPAKGLQFKPRPWAAGAVSVATAPKTPAYTHPTPRPCPADCQLMVLLDLSRSYESMRRTLESSEHKRCWQPGLRRLLGGVGGVWMMDASHG